MISYVKTYILAFWILWLPFGWAGQRPDTLSIEKVEELKAGTKVYGFSTIGPGGMEKFTGRLWGVLKNTIGPGHNWIVVELNGGNFRNSGVIAGQSGSPVFVTLNNKAYQIGTISYADLFTKNPIAYLTPIDEVLNSEFNKQNGNEPPPMQLFEQAKDLLSKNGFEKMSLGKSFSIGMAAKAKSDNNKNNEAQAIKPGSVLGVQLAWGDFDITGYGTVSYVEGEKIYMFGHPFLQLGPVEYRLVSAKVLGVQSRVSSSYIIAAPLNEGKSMGVITQDREAGIFGVLGKEPENFIPVSVHLVTSNSVKKDFSFKTVSDSWAGPILVGLGVYYSVGSWSRAIGDHTLFASGKIELEDGSVEFNEAFVNKNSYTRENKDVVSSLFFLIRDRVAAILANDYSKARIKNIDIDVQVFDEIRILNIDNVVLDSPILRPGSRVTLKISLSQPRYEPKIAVLSFDIPNDVGSGNGKIIIGNALAIDKLEKKESQVINLKTLIQNLNQDRRPDAIYVYVVYPPSDTPEENESRKYYDEESKVKRVSKRLFSNVEEYEILTKSFIVSGEKSVVFMISPNNHSVQESEGNNK